MSLNDQLVQALQAAGLPVTGVSIGTVIDRTTWRLDFAVGATAEQKAQAEAVKLSVDLSDDAAYKDALARARFDDEKLTKAVAIWAAQKLGVPLATARAEIVAIYKGL